MRTRAINDTHVVFILLTKQFIIWSSVIFQKLIIAHLVNIFPTCYGTRGFVTDSTKVHY